MQIHEVTRPITEGILSTIGQDIKSAVGGAVDKVGAVLNTPGALTTGRGYGAALDKAERAQADRTLQQQTQQQAKKYTQGWINHIKASGVDPAAPTTRAEPGQMPADVAASAQGQKMLKALGPPRGLPYACRVFCPWALAAKSAGITPGAARDVVAAGSVPKDFM